MEIPHDILTVLENSEERANCIPVPFGPARTIILIGRTRTGKSTIAAVLKNSIYAPPKIGIYCGTEEPSVKKVEGLTIIDMPGFFNQNEFGTRTNLSNEIINRMLSRQIRTVDVSQTLFAFVFNTESGINREDISTMLLVKSKYPDINKRLMLVLTHCEEINAGQRKQRVDDFFNEELVQRNRLRELFQYGILYMGSIRPESIEQHDTPAILREYANVVNMRNEFIRQIFGDTHSAAPIENRAFNSEDSQRRGRPSLKKNLLIGLTREVIMSQRTTTKKVLKLDDENGMTFDELMETIENTVAENDPFLFVKSNTRNIILMGRARTGKSTVALTLEKACYIPEPNLSLYSETKEIESHRVATPILKSGELFNFNIIDTPGLYDQTVNVGERLSNESITKLIRKCMKEDMTNIHCFAFVFNLHNGINNEDIKSMLFVQKNYPGIKKHMILLLTHSEEITKQARETLVENFFKHEVVVNNNLKEFFGAGVFYMGCLRPQLRDNPNERAATNQVKNILEMRSTVLQFLIKKTTYYNIHHDPTEQGGAQSTGKCRAM